MSFIADTDVLIDFLRDRGDYASIVEMELKTGNLCTTAVTAFELWVGARSEKEKAAVGTLLSAISIIPLDSDGSHRAGEIFRTLETQGKRIGMADSLIAGICLSRNGILITRNKDHFARIGDLKISDHQSL